MFTGNAYLATSGTDSIHAQEADAIITFNDQRSDGGSVVIAEARTSVNARLLIVTGTSTVFRRLQLEGGTEFMDRTVDLTKPIQESQRIRAELRTTDGNDELLARDRTLIAVDESLSEARSTVRLSNGQAELIEPDSEAGFSYPYFLFKPQPAPDTARPLYVEPHNASEVSTRSELRTQVRGDARSYLRPPNELGLPRLIPAFPRPPDDGPDFIQSLGLISYRSDESTYSLQEISSEEFPTASLKRVDKQLVSMVTDDRSRLDSEGYTVGDQIHMNGFSGSAQFAARFAFLYPNMVGAISLGGNGAYPLPKESKDGIELPYPLGTADYQRIMERRFDLTSWKDINQYIYVGQEDQVYYPYSQRYREKVPKVFGEDRVTDRFPVTKSVYESVGANAIFPIYEEDGHRFTSKMRQDVIDFHWTVAGITTTPTPVRSRTEKASETAPRFDIVGGLAGVAGISYVLKRHLDGTA